jgi:hypothetical protein
MKPNAIKWQDIKRAAVVLGIIDGKPWGDHYRFAITPSAAHKLRRMLKQTGMVRGTKRGHYEILER